VWRHTKSLHFLSLSLSFISADKRREQLRATKNDRDWKTEIYIRRDLPWERFVVLVETQQRERKRDITRLLYLFRYFVVSRQASCSENSFGLKETFQHSQQLITFLFQLPTKKAFELIKKLWLFSFFSYSVLFFFLPFCETLVLFLSTTNYSLIQRDFLVFITLSFMTDLRYFFS